MTDWAISVPVRDPAESLVDTAWHVRELPPEDRSVARQIIFDAATSGMDTAGDLLDHLDALTVPERRALLDAARVACDLPTTETVDAGRAVEAASAAGLARMESGLMACAAADCHVVPTTASGALRPVDCRRWWCDAHRHLAAEGDLDPRPSPWRLSASGAIVPNDPAAESAEAAAALSRQAVEASKLADAEADAAELAATERARAEQMRRETPLGVPSI